jgi:histidinol-phosphatase (PHP family)
MSAEVSSAGWRKPAGEQYTSQSLLAKLARRNVPLTTASDTHGVGNVAFRAADLRALVEAAGGRSLASYRSRVRGEVPLG